MNNKTSIFWSQEEGFSTVGMVLALLISISLMFTAARVYEVNSAAASVQEVADAAALAAENTVAEFYVVAAVCDALVLSLSLASTLSLGLGVACLCTPYTASFAHTFLQAAQKLKDARDKTYSEAQKALNTYQNVLPFLAIVKAQEVFSANSKNAQNSASVGAGNHGLYSGIALLVPWQAQTEQTLTFNKGNDAHEKVRQNKEELEAASKKAEEAAKKAKESKERAYQHDSGSESQYCMYERASHLAFMQGAENPYYASSETWNFLVALKRAQIYYQKRAAQEKPTSNSVAERSNSSLRKRFYEFASAELIKGYVHETADSFKAYFPLLPRNTEEMRKTNLYTEKRYPISEHDGHMTMHAWSGCPKYAQQTAHGQGSIKDLEQGEFITCDACKFTPSSMGSVASASTNINNGFEYHYLIVAEQAAQYQKAREEAAPYTKQAKDLGQSLFSSLKEALAEIGAQRIKVSPPGRFGVVCIALNQNVSSSFARYSSLFINDGKTLGMCVALSAAALVKEPSSEQASVLNECLDGFVGNAPAFGPLRIVFDMWSSLLRAYTEGQTALLDALQTALNAVHFSSESGLGTWAHNALVQVVESAGFEPVDLSSPKAVLVNSEHVLSQDNSVFSSRLLEVKHKVLSSPFAGGNPFGNALDALQNRANERIDALSDGFTVATIEIFDGEVSIPLTLTLPGFVANEAKGVLAQGIESLKQLAARITGVKLWR